MTMKSPTPKAPSYRILVVDDAEPVADLLSVLLGAMGHEVYTAINGDVALRQAAEWHPDIVLSDLSMPGMDGYQLAQHLRTESNNRDLVLVALSGNGEVPAKAKAFEAGFDHFLVKPISEVGTLQALFNTIAGERVR